MSGYQTAVVLECKLQSHHIFSLQKPRSSVRRDINSIVLVLVLGSKMGWTLSRGIQLRKPQACPNAHSQTQPASFCVGPLRTMSQQLISAIRKASLSPNYQCVISALMKCLQEATLSACIVGTGR